MLPTPELSKQHKMPRDSERVGVTERRGGKPRLCITGLRSQLHRRLRDDHKFKASVGNLDPAWKQNVKMEGEGEGCSLLIEHWPRIYH